MKKIKWKNVFKVAVLIACGLVVVHDAYMLTIGSLVTGNLYGWSWYGLITFMLCWFIGGITLEDVLDQFKKMSNVGSKRHLYK